GRSPHDRARSASCAGPLGSSSAITLRRGTTARSIASTGWDQARQVNRKIRPLRLAAGTDYAGTLMLHVRAQGLDLLDPDDAAWLRATVADARPDLLLTGPIYKLAGGDPTEERTAKAVSAQLDYLRVQHGAL
ncbi:MAG: hypothetical protein ACRDQU_09850, partial [Pseudonocardiaceae bacterium]